MARGVHTNKFVTKIESKSKKSRGQKPSATAASKTPASKKKPESPLPFRTERGEVTTYINKFKPVASKAPKPAIPVVQKI
jgi:hypothetical protein